MPIIEGKYEMTTSDKFEEYMKAVGVGLITRKLAAGAKPVAIIKKTGDDEYYFKTSTTFKTTEIKFKLGVPFKEETADGRTCQATLKMDGERLRHDQVCNGMNLSMWREFTPGQMIMTLEAPSPDGKGKIISTRVYKKIE